MWTTTLLLYSTTLLFLSQYIYLNLKFPLERCPLFIKFSLQSHGCHQQRQWYNLGKTRICRCVHTISVTNAFNKSVKLYHYIYNDNWNNKSSNRCNCRGYIIKYFIQCLLNCVKFRCALINNGPRIMWTMCGMGYGLIDYPKKWKTMLIGSGNRLNNLKSGPSTYLVLFSLVAVQLKKPIQLGQLIVNNKY